MRKLITLHALRTRSKREAAEAIENIFDERPKAVQFRRVERLKGAI
jgi:hypothetical protein